MDRKTLKYSAIVFAGGMSYGVMATTTKIALEEGFRWEETVASQPFCGIVLFAVAFVVLLAKGKKPFKVTPRLAASLVALGACSFLTSTLYNAALPNMPATVAITLLFQYTWIGVIVQVIVARKRPHATEVVAALTIVGGTILASGVLGENLGSLRPVDVLLCLLAAVSMAVYMHLSGHVGVGLEPVQRGMTACLGACAMAFVLCPTFFTSGVIEAGIWRYGFVLGACGLVLPIILFGIGAPHLPTGISTIMASSELPSGILVSVMVLHEPMTPVQAVGIAIILVGVVVSQAPSLMPARRRSRPSS